MDPLVTAAIIQGVGQGLSAAFMPDAPEQKDSRVTEQEKRIMRISAQLNKIRQERRARERGPLVENAARLLSTPGAGGPVDPETDIDASRQALASGQNLSQPSRPQYTTSRPGTRRHNNASRFVGASNRQDMLQGQRMEADDIAGGMGEQPNLVSGQSASTQRPGQQGDLIARQQGQNLIVDNDHVNKFGHDNDQDGKAIKHALSQLNPAESRQLSLIFHGAAGLDTTGAISFGENDKTREMTTRFIRDPKGFVEHNGQIQNNPLDEGSRTNRPSNNEEPS